MLSERDNIAAPDEPAITGEACRSFDAGGLPVKCWRASKLSRDVVLFLMDRAALPPDDMMRFADVLSRGELEFAGSLRHDGRRRQFIGGRLLTRLALSSRFPSQSAEAWEFHTGADGKVRHGNDSAGCPHFNISHTERYTLVGICPDGEIGVDIEAHSAYCALNLTDEMLSAAEKKRLSALAKGLRAEAFIALWTAKEAAAKLDGAGVMLDFAAVEVNRLLTRAVINGAHGGKTAILDQQVLNLNGEPHSIAIAIKG